MRSPRLALVAALALVASGCVLYLPGVGGVVSPVQGPSGFLYTSHRAPLAPDVNATPTTDVRKGEARVFYLRDAALTGLPLLSLGDASIEAAMRAGNLRELYWADYELTQVIGVFVEYRTIAYGR